MTPSPTHNEDEIEKQLREIIYDLYRPSDLVLDADMLRIMKVITQYGDTRERAVIRTISTKLKMTEAEEAELVAELEGKG